MRPVISAEHDVRPDLHMEATPVGGDAQRPPAATAPADDGAQLERSIVKVGKVTV